MYVIVGVTPNGEVEATEHDTLDKAERKVREDRLRVNARELIGTGMFDVNTGQPARPIKAIFSDDEAEAELFIARSHAHVGLQKSAPDA